jgi:hypothetical protein
MRGIELPVAGGPSRTSRLDLLTRYADRVARDVLNTALCWYVRQSARF